MTAKQMRAFPKVAAKIQELMAARQALMGPAKNEEERRARLEAANKLTQEIADFNDCFI